MGTKEGRGERAKKCGKFESDLTGLTHRTYWKLVEDMIGWVDTHDKSSMWYTEQCGFHSIVGTWKGCTAVETTHSEYTVQRVKAWTKPEMIGGIFKP